MTAVLARRWRCPCCHTVITEPVRVAAVTHDCHTNRDGTHRKVPHTVHLTPADNEPAIPAQLRLEVAK